MLIATALPVAAATALSLTHSPSGVDGIEHALS
jgi:hypothetical protein